MNLFDKIKKILSGNQESDNVDDHNKLNQWESLMGTLCFNIWNHTSQEFKQSKDYNDMEWPLLCGLYVFQNWERSNLSKKFMIKEMESQISKQVLTMKSELIMAHPHVRSKVYSILSSREENALIKVEPSKIFISLFNEALIGSYGDNIKSINPLDYFQFGLEILLLFTMEIKDKDRMFYDLIDDIGSWEKGEAEIILQNIVSSFGLKMNE